MSEPKVIWSGTYAGMAAMVDSGGVVLLDACRVRGGYVRDAILVHAVGQVATERDELCEQLAKRDASEQGILDAAMKARFDLEAVAVENEALRERLAKLETAVRDFTCEEREDLTETFYDDRVDKPAWADEIKAHRERISGLRAMLLKGAGDVKT